MKIERTAYRSTAGNRDDGRGSKSGGSSRAPERGYREEAYAGQRRGGSRYADKAARDRKKNRRRGRKSSGRRRGFLTFLLLLALAAAVCGGLFFLLPKALSWADAKIRKSQGTVELPQVELSFLYSPYAVLLDENTGKEIGANRADDKIFPASMTKILTVWTAIDEIGEKNLDQKITMSYDYYEELYAQDASRAGFEPGEEASIRDLLYGALLPSGAECCMQLALEAAGSESDLVELMNQKALDLGLTQTHFTNCTGLHDDSQYSTAREIGLILRAALQNDTFRTVFTTHYYTVAATEEHPEGFTFWSTLFKSVESDSVNGGKIMGGKTGYTSEAGHCLASMAEIGGNDYILVTAGWADVSEDEINSYHISDAFTAYNLLGTELGYGSGE